MRRYRRFDYNINLAKPLWLLTHGAIWWQEMKACISQWGKLLCYWNVKNIDSSSWTITNSGWQLARFKPSSHCTKELRGLVVIVVALWIEINRVRFSKASNTILQVWRVEIDWPCLWLRWQSGCLWHQRTQLSRTYYATFGWGKLSQ